MKPLRLLDLFCGAGGCSVGYHRAGFEVVGVDHSPQPDYPFEFHQEDALLYLIKHGQEFDVVHASPPCQVHSVTGNFHNDITHADRLPQTRKLLIANNRPYVIENVVGAPLNNPIQLCGTSFGLYVVRHRLFEHSLPLPQPPPCDHKLPVVQPQGAKPNRWLEYHSPVGNFADLEYAQLAMGIDWTSNRYSIAQAIPPAYTAWIGRHYFQQLLVL